MYVFAQKGVIFLKKENILHHLEKGLVSHAKGNIKTRKNSLLNFWGKGKAELGNIEAFCKKI